MTLPARPTAAAHQPGTDAGQATGSASSSAGPAAPAATLASPAGLPRRPQAPLGTPLSLPAAQLHSDDREEGEELDEPTKTGNAAGPAPTAAAAAGDHRRRPLSKSPPPPLRDDRDRDRDRTFARPLAGGGGGMPGPGPGPRRDRDPYWDDDRRRPAPRGRRNSRSISPARSFNSRGSWGRSRSGTRGLLLRATVTVIATAGGARIRDGVGSARPSRPLPNAAVAFPATGFARPLEIARASRLEQQPVRSYFLFLRRHCRSGAESQEVAFTRSPPRGPRASSSSLSTARPTRDDTERPPPVGPKSGFRPITAQITATTSSSSTENSPTTGTFASSGIPTGPRSASGRFAGSQQKVPTGPRALSGSAAAGGAPASAIPTGPRAWRTGQTSTSVGAAGAALQPPTGPAAMRTRSREQSQSPPPVPPVAATKSKSTRSHSRSPSSPPTSSSSGLAPAAPPPMPPPPRPPPPPAPPSEEDLARAAAERERAEAQLAREREMRESVRRRAHLARWLPRSANGLLAVVPGVNNSMLVSPGAEFEAEILRVREARRALLEPYHAQLISALAVDTALQVALAEAESAREVRRLAHGEDPVSAPSQAAGVAAVAMSTGGSGY
ncbi:hypothetical protein JCM3774_000347 [Rhodotorula dairenensis]